MREVIIAEVIKDICGIAFLTYILISPISDWWSIFAVVIITSTYKSFAHKL